MINYYTPLFFDIIDSVFTLQAPKATIKIGLIYLAKILNFYPDYTPTYLNILLNSNDNISVLNSIHFLLSYTNTVIC